MRLRVVSEPSEFNNSGLPTVYKVVNADTGELVDGVISVDIRLSPYGSRATIEMTPELDIEIDDVQIKTQV
jgi:hypothetical protein